MFKYYPQQYINMRKKIPFESEFILHKLTQEHLKELFDLECVASEIQLDGLRMDNLAFDMKTNSFVVIEYKNELNHNVFQQAQDYCDLIRKKPEKFINRLDNIDHVNLEDTRIMIIGPEFSDEQINETECPFELWKISLFDNGGVTYENLKTNKVKTLNINLEDLKLSKDSLLENKSPEIREIYIEFKEKLMENFENLQLRIMIDATSFRVNNQLICIADLKSSVKLYFFSENIRDDENRLRDISDITTGSLANWEFKFDSKSDIDYAIGLFKQVYDEKNI